MRFLGVLLDKNLTWKSHIETIEKKTVVFSFIHSYLTDRSIVWASINKTKLNNLLIHQERAARIKFFKDNLTHVKQLLQSMNILNIYQLNIFQILLFMYRVKNNQTPNIFYNIFSKLKSK